MESIEVDLPGCSYFAHRFIASSGERLAVVLDRRGNLPPLVLTRFLLRERSRGGAARLLKLCRRLAELYNWFESRNNEIEPQLLDGKVFSPVEFLAALADLDEDIRATPATSTRRLKNQRIWAWSEYLTFIARPDLWKTGLSIDDSHRLRENRKVATEDTIAELREELTNQPESRHHIPLNLEELRCIDAVLEASSKHNIFSGVSLMRNRCMYLTARYGALRIGELLKLRTDDLPAVESAYQALLRDIDGSPNEMLIIRRPDDKGDPRLYEPRVKRGSRAVSMPDCVNAEIQAYLKHTQTASGVPNYIFVAQKSRRPLSISRSEKIITAIGNAAAREFVERFQHNRHTLGELTWHRLRATRAIELLPVFFKGMRWNPNDEDDYLRFFGWNDRRSAAPYLSLVHRGTARGTLAEHNAAIGTNR